MEEESHTLMASLCLAVPANADPTELPKSAKAPSTGRKTPLSVPDVAALTKIHVNEAAISLTSPCPPQPQSALLRLPAEIRDIILTLILVQPAPINTNLIALQWGNDIAAVLAWLSLSRSCRQIRQEAHTIFFGVNAFHFYIMKPLPSMPDHSFSMIRNLVLYRWRFGGRAELIVELPRRDGVDGEPRMQVRMDDVVDPPVKKLKGVPVSLEEVKAAADLPMAAIGVGFRDGEPGLRRKWVQTAAEFMRMAWRCEEEVAKTLGSREGGW